MPLFSSSCGGLQRWGPSGPLLCFLVRKTSGEKIFWQKNMSVSWQLAGVSWQVSVGSCQLAVVSWQVAGGSQEVSGDSWQLAGGSWQVLGGSW